MHLAPQRTHRVYPVRLGSNGALVSTDDVLAECETLSASASFMNEAQTRVFISEEINPNEQDTLGGAASKRDQVHPVGGQPVQRFQPGPAFAQ